LPKKAKVGVDLGGPTGKEKGGRLLSSEREEGGLKESEKTSHSLGVFGHTVGGEEKPLKGGITRQGVL